MNGGSSARNTSVVGKMAILQSLRSRYCVWPQVWIPNYRSGTLRLRESVRLLKSCSQGVEGVREDSSNRLSSRIERAAFLMLSSVRNSDVGESTISSSRSRRAKAWRPSSGSRWLAASLLNATQSKGGAKVASRRSPSICPPLNRCMHSLAKQRMYRAPIPLLFANLLFAMFCTFEPRENTCNVTHGLVAHLG